MSRGAMIRAYKRRQAHADRNLEIVRLHRCGLTNPDIGAIVGLSRWRVSKVLAVWCAA